MLKNYKMKLNHQTGILLATVGLFTAIVGYGLTFIIPMKIGYFITCGGIIVGGLGLGIHFFYNGKDKII